MSNKSRPSASDDQGAVVSERCDGCNRLIAAGEVVAIDSHDNHIYCGRCQARTVTPSERQPQPQAKRYSVTMERGNIRCEQNAREKSDV
jgi:ribosomal protein S27AE